MGFWREDVLIWAGGIIAVFMLVVGALYMPIQLMLVLLGTLVALVLHRRTAVVVFIILMLPTLSLVRRIAAGRSAYVESDPLILLPLILTVGVVAVSLASSRTDPRPAFHRVLTVALIVGVAATVVLRGAFSANGLFYAGLIIVPMLLATVLSTGRLPPVWPVVLRVLPVLAIAVGVYGVIQFFVLPSWDSAWMVSSELTSIGSPYPQQVRVFGASESPGPYALFMGISLTLSLGMAVLAKSGGKKFGWLLVSGIIAVPLLLSGVRSALLGVVVCVALLALTRAKGFARVVLVVFLIGGYQLLTVMISEFGSQSTILTTDRYSDLSNDTSLLARLDLLQYLSNPFKYIIGNPDAPVVDNLYIDVLVRYGLLPAAALFILFILVAIRSFKLLRSHQNETAALCVWFLLIQSLFGNIFNALVGILVGVILGTIMSAKSECAALCHDNAARPGFSPEPMLTRHINVRPRIDGI